MVTLFGNRIEIKRDEKEKETKSGIILMGKSQKEKQTGTVLAVGTSADPKLLGQKVFFDPNCGTRFDEDNVGYLFQSDIWGIIKN